jgi:hypothetical protein
MSKLEFDFRMGLNKDHIVYKHKGINWQHCIYYFGYLTFTWGYVVACFALFQYVYINYEPIAFPLYIVLWLVFVLTIVGIAIANLRRYNQAKMNKINRAQCKSKGEVYAVAFISNENQNVKIKQTQQERPEI